MIQNADSVVPKAIRQQRDESRPTRERACDRTGPRRGRCFEQKRGVDFVAEQWTLDRPGLVGQLAPVGAELERHDDSRDDPHAEGDREYLEPEIEQAPIDVLPGRQRQGLQRRQPCGEPDGERGKDDVKGNGERELNARQQERVEIHDQPIPVHGPDAATAPARASRAPVAVPRCPRRRGGHRRHRRRMCRHDPIASATARCQTERLRSGQNMTGYRR